MPVYHIAATEKMFAIPLLYLPTPSGCQCWAEICSTHVFSHVVMGSSTWMKTVPSMWSMIARLFSVLWVCVLINSQSWSNNRIYPHISSGYTQVLFLPSQILMSLELEVNYIFILLHHCVCVRACVCDTGHGTFTWAPGIELASSSFCSQHSDLLSHF